MEKVIEDQKENAEKATKQVQSKKLEYETSLDALFDELDKGDYFKQSYAPGSKVELDGTLFASLINFINDHKRSLYSVQQMLNLLTTTVDAMLTDNAAVTIELMKAHRDNVDNGNSVSMEEMDKIDAKENIKEIIVEEKKPKKSKMKKV